MSSVGEPPTMNRRSHHDYLRLMSTRSALESADSAAAASRTADALQSEEFRDEQLAMLLAKFARIDEAIGPPPEETVAARAQVMEYAKQVLGKLARDPLGAHINPQDSIGLEALVHLNGRPSIPVRDGDIDLNDPDLGEWQGTFVLARDAIRKTVDSVGRIDSDGAHAGTGFVVAPGMVMTNRHVLQVLAQASPRAGGGEDWSFTGVPTIDFAKEIGSTKKRAFGIKKVIFTGTDPIGSSVDLRHLDMAVLEVERTNTAGDELPPPLDFARDAQISKDGSKVYVVGYPAIPGRLPLDGSARDQQLITALERIFRFKFGVKRVAPGEINPRRGAVVGDVNDWTMGHDATTLGGNSGSCVTILDPSSNAVLGLHFGGEFFHENYAHTLATVSALQGPPLSDLGIPWV